MMKNRYEVTGITSDGTKFKGTCIAFDIISAIQLFRDKDISVHTVPSRTQVNANSEVGIENVDFIMKG